MDWHRIWPAGAAGHRLAVAGVLGLALLGAAGADTVARADTEFGESRDHQLQAQSVREFGVVRPLEESSPAQIGKAEAEADPTKLATLAGGLRARVVTSGVAAPNLDMLALWPNDESPTHLIAC